MKVVIHDLIQLPGRVGARVEITDTHQGELYGIPATDKKVNFRLHEFHTIENGLVKTTWHMEDWFGLFLQLDQFPRQA
ncbi:ester cyclase [Rhodoferax sp. GW822-FHT02A01]|uniref:ester cyclase n=1 Tax=Rhodoferax sp. GW822-FHT02A01 TaxID=3141537 RepID=UPI00315CA022